MIYILRPENKVLHNVIADLGNLDPHKTHTVEIKDEERGKTVQQRKYFHKLLSVISKHTGETIEFLKSRACLALEYYDIAEYKKDVIHPATGYVIFKAGESYAQRWSTEQLNTEQYSKLIEGAQIMCMYLKINYPDPNYFGLDIK